MSDGYYYVCFLFFQIGNSLGDEKISGAVTAKLTLRDVQKDDAGEYRCVVQRGYGSATEYNSKTVTANLTVKGELATVRVNRTDV